MSGGQRARPLVLVKKLWQAAQCWMWQAPNCLSGSSHSMWPLAFYPGEPPVWSPTMVPFLCSIWKHASWAPGWWLLTTKDDDLGETRNMHAPRVASRAQEEGEAAATGAALRQGSSLALLLCLGLLSRRPCRLPSNTATTDLTSARSISASMLLRFRVKADQGGRRHQVQYTVFY